MFPEDAGLSSVAIAAGAYIFVYRNLRPYFKITMPLIPLHESESKVWKAGRTAIETRKLLRELQFQGVPLSATAIEIVGDTDLGEHEDTIIAARTKLPIRCAVCTCFAALSVEQEEPGCRQQLLAGTEAGLLIVFQRHGSEPQTAIPIGGTPTLIAVTGTLTTGWRAAVALRDGNVCIVRDGKLLPSNIKCEAAIAGLGWVQPSIESGDRGKHLVVAMTNGIVKAFYGEGRVRWEVNLRPCIISAATCFSQLSSTSIDSSGILIGTTGGHLYTVVQGKLISKLNLGESSADSVVGIAFGDYAREGNAAIVTMSSGALHVLVLKRRASVILKSLRRQSGRRGDMIGAESAPALEVPKKSKLFISAAQREKEFASDIHEIFQRDVLRMKLSAARSYVRVAASGRGPTAVVGIKDKSASLRLSTTIEGIERQFLIKARLQSTGQRVLRHLALVAAPSDASIIAVPAVSHIPCLLPDCALDISVKVFVHTQGPKRGTTGALKHPEVSFSLVESVDQGKQWGSNSNAAAAAAMSLHGIPLAERPMLSAIQKLPLGIA